MKSHWDDSGDVLFRGRENSSGQLYSISAVYTPYIQRDVLYMSLNLIRIRLTCVCPAFKLQGWRIRQPSGKQPNSAASSEAALFWNKNRLLSHRRCETVLMVYACGVQIFRDV